MADYRCPNCGEKVPVGLGVNPKATCLTCGEELEHDGRRFVRAAEGTYEPMDRAKADEIVARYSHGQPFTLGAKDAAELIEARLVLAGASRSRIYAMRESILGPGANG